MQNEANPVLAAWKRLEAMLRAEGHAHSEVRFDMGNFALVWAWGGSGRPYYLAIAHHQNSWWSITDDDEPHLTIAAPFAAEFVTRVRQMNAIARDPAAAVALIDDAAKSPASFHPVKP